MSKVKYYYDSDTLSYRKIEKKKGRAVGFVFLFFLASFLFSLLLLFTVFNLTGIRTPNEKAMERELTNLEFQFDLLNRKMEDAENVLEDLAERDNNLYRIYFETNPIPEEQRKAGFGGINRYKGLEGFENSKLITNTHKRLDILTKQIVVQSRSLDEIRNLADRKEELLSTIPAIQPIKNSDLKRIASGYGWRSDPFTKAKKFHWGMDFSAVTGTPVFASGNGVVTRADNTASGYGNHIRVDHGFGYQSLYAHLYKYNVKIGQIVKRGDVIGFVGSTGRSVAPHLHYEIFKDGERINPRNFYYGSLTSEEFDEMLKASSAINETLD